MKNKIGMFLLFLLCSTPAMATYQEWKFNEVVVETQGGTSVPSGTTGSLAVLAQSASAESFIKCGLITTATSKGSIQYRFLDEAGNDVLAVHSTIPKNKLDVNPQTLFGLRAIGGLSTTALETVAITGTKKAFLYGTLIKKVEIFLAGKLDNIKLRCEGAQALHTEGVLQVDIAGNGNVTVTVPLAVKAGDPPTEIEIARYEAIHASTGLPYTGGCASRPDGIIGNPDFLSGGVLNCAEGTTCNFGTFYFFNGETAEVTGGPYNHDLDEELRYFDVANHCGACLQSTYIVEENIVPENNIYGWLRDWNALDASQLSDVFFLPAVEATPGAVLNTNFRPTECNSGEVTCADGTTRPSGAAYLSDPCPAL